MELQWKMCFRNRYCGKLFRIYCLIILHFRVSHECLKFRGLVIIDFISGTFDVESFIFLRESKIILSVLIIALASLLIVIWKKGLGNINSLQR